MFYFNKRAKKAVIEKDWAYRFFDRNAEQNHLISDSPHSKPVSPKQTMVDTRPWATRLFTTAAAGIETCDKLAVTINRELITELEIQSKRCEILLGSHRLADVSLKAASPFHAKITCRQGNYQIEDLGSKAGTFVNGIKLPAHQPQQLSKACLISIMAFQIRFLTDEKYCQPYFCSQQSHPSDFLWARSKNAGLPNNCFNLTQTKTEPTKKASSWTKGSIELQVAKVIDETHNVKTFRLVGIKPMSFDYLPGQFFSLLVTIDGEKVQRSFSMSSSPTRPHALELTVKRVPGGLVSNWLSDNIKVGDTLTIKGPAGRFSCALNPARKLLFIGAGSGLAPLMSMIRWLHDTKLDVDSKILLSFRNRSDIIFEKELRQIATTNRHMTIEITLTGQMDRSDEWDGLNGRIDAEKMQTCCDDLDERELYLCGPAHFMQSIKDILLALNFPMQQLHCENFYREQNPTSTTNQQNSKTHTNKSQQCNNAGKKHKIRFVKSNQAIETDGGTTLLALAKDAGIAIDHYCQNGSCGECMVKCLSGKVAMSEECEIDEHERQQGWVFSCQSFPRSDLEIEA